MSAKGLSFRNPVFSNVRERKENYRSLPVWPGLNPGVNSLCGLSLFLVFFSALRSFSRNTQVFFSHHTLTHSWSNSKFDMYSVSSNVVVSADNWLTCNTSLVAFFVGLS